MYVKLCELIVCDVSYSTELRCSLELISHARTVISNALVL
jgi:hypothetical protein